MPLCWPLLQTLAWGHVELRARRGSEYQGPMDSPSISLSSSETSLIYTGGYSCPQQGPEYQEVQRLPKDTFILPSVTHHFLKLTTSQLEQRFGPSVLHLSESHLSSSLSECLLTQISAFDYTFTFSPFCVSVLCHTVQKV